MAKGKRIYTGEEFIASVFRATNEEAVIIGKRIFEEAYDWTSDPKALDILPRYIIQQMIDEGGGGSAALKFTLTADPNGDIDLSGLTDLNDVPMPIPGTLASSKAAYVGNTDFSQSLTYNPTTQVLSTYNGGETFDILITF